MLVSAISDHDRRTSIMLDCGFSVKEAERRLARLDMLPAEVAGIVVTHEHGDHIRGVFKFARRYGTPVWLSYGTYQAAQADSHGVDIHFCRDDEVFSIGELQVHPYTVPHDAREPLQYCISSSGCKLGVLTDVGHKTDRIVSALSGCDALVLEWNHDAEMLSNSSYPYSLKMRIGGPHGHLSNAVAAEILREVDKSKLKLVIAAHLSQQNNKPELVERLMADVLEGAMIEIGIACQHQGFGWKEVR
ncbi:MBL fold metallo-hydrolase [Undibacterium terreum]|uniref:MBL fold metallo-hydrolase n=1 Tax=Undibacterium terreum TaxID=1224302 RepID=A0A916UVG0_9BURK|nr:MBL fold metallo-hydrolase [Undibacterium terreum]